MTEEEKPKKEDDANFMTKAKFTKLIENCVRDTRLSYIDAVVHMCEETQIDPADIKKYISPSIKQKIEVEAQELNFLPKQNTLLFD